MRYYVAFRYNASVHKPHASHSMQLLFLKSVLWNTRTRHAPLLLPRRAIIAALLVFSSRTPKIALPIRT